MDYPNRLEWQTRCEFNAYCKRALRNELIDACRERKRRQLREVIFSDLTPQEERQLYTVDKYFQDEEAEPSYQQAGKKITPKLLLEAIRTLPEEKRKAIMLYYFEGMTDVEIGKLFNTSRSTIQYRRTSSFEILKKYLEEHADEWDEW
jgi:RNA polymerase sigma factor (sigma-70 family)